MLPEQTEALLGTASCAGYAREISGAPPEKHRPVEWFERTIDAGVLVEPEPVAMEVVGPDLVGAESDGSVIP